MIRNYLLIAVRNIRRNFRFSLINILGLSFGLTCCLAIYLYVQDEYSYDRFQEKYERIYQVLYTTSNGMKLAQVPPPIGPLMEEYHPEVETAARIYRRNATVAKKGSIETYEEEDILFADSALTDIFTFHWISGNKEQFLLEPGKVWISETMAGKYFPGEEALGKELIVNGSKLYQVAGVLEDYPNNSHIQFKMILAYEEMYNMENEAMQAVLRKNFSINWVVSHSLTYVLLKENARPEAVNERFASMLLNYAPENLRLGQTFSLVPLENIHFLEDVLLEPRPLGNRQYVYIFSAIAFLTLLIACFNYINLSTAQSVRRMKEIGMRKTLGARMNQLFLQFLGESALLTLISFILAMGMLYISFPYLEVLTGKSYSMEMLGNPATFGGLLLIFFLTALLGGAYPAFYISKVNTLKSLKGKVVAHDGNTFSLRRVLVVFQFAITIILIAGSIIIYSQLNFLLNQPLGFSSQGVINIPILSESLNNAFGGVNEDYKQRLTTFGEEVKQHSAVKAVTFSSNVPGLGSVGRYGKVEGQEEDENQVINTLSVDHDFLHTYEIELIAGRNFSKTAAGDEAGAYIINETAVKEYYWGSPAEALGKEINMEGKKGNVIGVVKNFRTNSLHNDFVPIVLHLAPSQFNTMSIALSGTTYDQNLDYLRSQWQQQFPEKAFEYAFLDQTLEDLYENESQFGSIVGVFAILAIFVSCLGAYGLMIIVTQQRLKEIGIRKVLGASVNQLYALMVKESTILLLVSFIIGVPVIWWWGSSWLSDYNIRIDLTAVPFLIGGLTSAILIIAVVSTQTFKAVTCNPASVIKDE